MLAHALHGLRSAPRGDAKSRAGPPPGGIVRHSYSDQDPLVIADERSEGLSLKVRGKAASWILKYKGKSRKLGSLNELTAVSAARDRTAIVRRMFDAGDDPSAYLKGLFSGGSHEEAMEANAARKSAEAGHWTWDDLVDRYVNKYLSAEKELEDGTKVPAKQSAIQEGVPYFSPHDLRRAFVSEVGSKTSRADATSAVLDHSTKLAEGVPFEDAAAVTRKFYDMSQRLQLKNEAIELWAETLISHYDEIFAEHYGKPRKLRAPRAASSSSHRTLTAGQKAKHKRDADWYAKREAENAVRTPKVLDLKPLKLTADADADADGDYSRAPDEWVED